MNVEKTPGPMATSAVLACLGVASGLLYWTLISISLDPALGIVHGMRDATCTGPLTWPASFLRVTGTGPEMAQAAYIILIVLLSGLWYAGIHIVKRERGHAATAVIACGFAVFATLLVLAPVFQSSDIFNYVFGGRAMSVYRSNPYTLLPSMRPHDPFYGLIAWKDAASVYGPIFSYLSCLLTRIAGNSVTANVICFKVMAALSYAACLPLVYHLARRVSPGRENQALMLGAWCPLLLLHIPGGAHNDMLAVTLVLGGYLLYRKGHLLWGLALVALALDVKLTAGLALVPLLVLYIRDRCGVPLNRLALGSLTCAAAVAVPYAGLWRGSRTFESTGKVASLYSASSVPDLFRQPLERLLTAKGVSPATADTIARGSIRLVFLVVFLVGAFVLLRRVTDFGSMARAAAALALLWLLTSTYVLPWYATLGVMLVSFSAWNLTTVMTLGAATVLLLYRLPLSGEPGGGATLYIALPLLLIAAGWALLGALTRATRARSAFNGTDGRRIAPSAPGGG